MNEESLTDTWRRETAFYRSIEARLTDQERLELKINALLRVVPGALDRYTVALVRLNDEDQWPFPEPGSLSGG